MRETDFNTWRREKVVQMSASMNRSENAQEDRNDMNVDQADASEHMDMAAHIRTYENFTTVAKYGIVAIALLLILMAVFLS